MRRSGRTTIILLKALIELMETGETTIVDHPIGFDKGHILHYPQRHSSFLTARFKDLCQGAFWTNGNYKFDKGTYDVKVLDNHIIKITDKSFPHGLR